MSPEPSIDPSTPVAPGTPVSAAAPGASPAVGVAPVATPRRTGVGTYLLGAVALAALVSSGLLWQKLNTIQEQLARQSADAGAQAVEARTMARQAEELVRDTAARLSVTEARVGEVALQRSQLEELMQSLSRSRDENLVVDIESAIRLAQQQAQLTGSLEPLVATLKSANQRIERAAQPRLAPVQRAIGRDLDRLTRATVTDTAGLLVRLDDLVRQVDELPVQNAVAQAAATRRLAIVTPGPANAGAAPQGDQAWWQATLQRSWEVVRDEARNLVRVSRIDQPEAILLAPEQTFFLRENLKLKLLNARLGVLARQFESARADLTAATAALNKYFDPASRRTQAAAALLQTAQASMKAAEQPRLDETLSALATAAAGR
ncbi:MULTISPECIES: uroporphyrinogen-III C-methyltransferase [Comamonadaceae]|uniref:uroporphyrinogen-III C-methyltransferase n=1 Tax=Comamonadaceae TaxID=80864 RepID=UPI00258C40F6|nr:MULTISPECIES: uroporphyrinogen-III C-methyltransferase [Comamonadaceae]MCM2346134.1 uroporphyrinogen-III C-methyltransferase [Acidovorax soli]